jgi:uncharacterized protein YndB with AHSA1/START domain
MSEKLQLTRVPSVQAGMLIRRPPGEVFQAFVDPEITTKFWFTHSSGRVEPGAKLQWDWEMYGLSNQVAVKEVEENRRIVLDWNLEEKPTTVEFRFIPWRDDTTYVRITETGLSGDGDEVAAYAADSTGGFSFVLASLKALLEHGVVLTVVLDHLPEGLEL